MKVGFIGLGVMGRPMAKNLQKSGCELLVSDHNPAVAAEFETLGARAMNNSDIAALSDVLFTMLPNGKNVKDLMLYEDGLGALMREGSIYIDMSSISPADSVEVANFLMERGVEMLDAPVSGGEPKAIDGTVAFMVGGRQEVFDRCLPLLLSMGASAVRCGDIGAGNTAKLANQIIVGVNIAAVSEALMMAKKSGANPQLVYEAIRGGLAGSVVLDAKAPMMIADSFKPGFRLDLHIKDLDNALGAGHDAGAPLPLTSLVLDMMRTLKADGCGGEDHGALVKFYEKLASSKVSGD